MPEILAHFGLARRAVPQTPEQYVALQIARTLKDDAHASEYLAAASRFPLATLLLAHRFLQAYGPPAERANHHFRTVLLNLQGRGHFNAQAQIVSFRVHRRAVGVAVLTGLSLNLVRVRELPSDSLRADDSALAFIRRTIEDFPGCLVAIEESGLREETRGGQLHAQAIRAVREVGSPLWQIGSSELIQSFAAPPLRSRAQFREAVERIWPDVMLRASNRTLLDATGLALFVQAKRFIAEEALDEMPICES